MAYEALIVIGFGAALAATSVALFWAHVQRINAPNKADPAGTVVEIDLAPALAKDEDARLRKVAAKKGSNSNLRRGSNLTTAVAATDFSVGLNCGIGAGVSCGASHGAAATGKGADSAEVQVVEGDAHRELPASRSTMILPSALWAEAILKHADVKRKNLRTMVKSGEMAAGWEARWERLPAARRRRLLEAVRLELVHAVSSYVGRDEALFDAVCPDLTVSALEEEHRGVTGLSRLVRRCLDGKLPEPRTRAYAAVQEALATAASAESMPKDKQAPLRAFLPTFRKLCSYSMSIGALEAVVSGRADGSAGPTVGSFCAALVKTGGSAVLMWAFFRGLQQMSASDAADSAVAELPEGPEEGGLL